MDYFKRFTEAMEEAVNVNKDIIVEIRPNRENEEYFLKMCGKPDSLIFTEKNAHFIFVESDNEISISNRSVQIKMYEDDFEMEFEFWYDDGVRINIIIQ